jgi:hypothetical protein
MNVETRSSSHIPRSLQSTIDSIESIQGKPIIHFCHSLTMTIPAAYYGSNQGDVTLRVDDEKIISSDSITCTNASSNDSCSVNPQHRQHQQQQVCRIEISPSIYDDIFGRVIRRNYFDARRGQPLALARMDSEVWRTMCSRATSVEIDQIAFMVPFCFFIILPWAAFLLAFFAPMEQDRSTHHPVLVAIWYVWPIFGGLIMCLLKRIAYNGFKQIAVDGKNAFAAQGYVVEFVRESDCLGLFGRPVLRFTPLEQARPTIP